MEHTVRCLISAVESCNARKVWGTGDAKLESSSAGEEGDATMPGPEYQFGRINELEMHHDFLQVTSQNASRVMTETVASSQHVDSSLKQPI